MQSEDLDVLLGGWILTCKEIIEKQHGIINKYVGDGFLAYWPDAVTSPEEIVSVISALKELQRKERPEFRFVVHSGAVATGGVAAVGEEKFIGGRLHLFFQFEKIASSFGEFLCLCEPTCASRQRHIHTPLHRVIHH